MCVSIAESNQNHERWPIKAPNRNLFQWHQCEIIAQLFGGKCGNRNRDHRYRDLGDLSLGDDGGAAAAAAADACGHD